MTMITQDNPSSSVNWDHALLKAQSKKTAKRAVSEVRGRMYDGLYQRLGTKEGEKDIYMMAKSRERKTRNIIQVKCINDETE
jgi:hypothetical protein